MFSFKKKQKYKLSEYNEMVAYEDFYLLYNQITGSLIKLKHKYRCVYQSLYSKKFNKKSNFHNTLVKQGFAVKSDFDEKKWLQKTWEQAGNRTGHKSITFAITGKCNLACVYCYEKGCLRHSMNRETQEKSIRFIKRLIEFTPTKTMNVVWYGGEPLMNLDGIIFLSEEIQKLCHKNNIKLKYNMITNGTLLTEEIMDRLLELKIKKLQITLDGDKTTHDARRPHLLKPERSSYDDIVNNLPKLYDKGFNVSLRINVDKTNTDQIKPLLAKFKKYIRRNKKGGSIKPHLGWTRSADLMPKVTWAKMNIYNMPGGLNGTALRPYTPCHCMATQKYAFAISPTGCLSRCWNTALDETDNTIDDLKLAETGWQSQGGYGLDANVIKQCYDCFYRPSCRGIGCVKCREDTDWINLQPDQFCKAIKWTLPNQIINLYKRKCNQKKQGKACDDQ